MATVLRFINSYKQIFGIFGLLVVICLFTAWQDPDAFLQSGNVQNTMRWTALFGIIAIGVSFVIMTGGIDLSIGSVIGLVGCLLAMFLSTTYLPEDELAVTAVDPGARKLSVAGGDVYQPEDRLSFLENVYTVESASADRITVREELRTGDRTGTLIRAREVTDPGSADKTIVRRGTQQMHSHNIVLQGTVPDLNPDDRIQLLYTVGLAQQFVVRSVTRGDGVTEIVYLTRRNQRVRDPHAVLLSKRSQRMPTWLALTLVLGVSLLIGLGHGLLITKIGLQPFIVTLCGLLFYRGLSRFITSDQEQGFGTEFPGLKQLAKGDLIDVLTGTDVAYAPPMPFVYLLALGVVAAVFLNRTIYGRYILALGRNTEAARYSGINTDRMVILAYMICSFCAGLAGILFALDLNSIQPSAHGEFYELYAIAAAVLGGCSLRGGEGSILGVIIAAGVMRVLSNAINLIDGIDTSTEFAIIGLVILTGVTVDELLKRLAAKRRAMAQAREARAGGIPAGEKSSGA